ncbi:hypothetical protein [Methylobacterium sp. 77]|uniref:hypothetical protein n=1 Tax=Methylobacterium sp. 77 TaxID=1101192 RepID=UPI0012DDA6B8|nr:hypothetical protein [Methylobacterium sp. 77]
MADAASDRKIQEAYKKTNAIWSALQKEYIGQITYYTEKVNNSVDEVAKNKNRTKLMYARICSEHCWSNIRG